MAVIRVEKNKDYTVVNNSYLRDKNLSLKTIGLMTIMLSLPENWDYTIEGLASLSKDGKTTIRTSLQELEENEYLVRKRKRDNLGKLTTTEYVLYEKNNKTPKLENPILENLTLENPTLENQTQLNTNIQSTNILNTNNNSTTTNMEKNIFEYIEENFGRTLNSIEYETIINWAEYNFPQNLLEYAVKKAVLKNIYTIGYIDKILLEWDKNNIRTVAQAQKADEDYSNRKQNKPANNFKSSRDRLRELEEQARIDDEIEALENAKA